MKLPQSQIDLLEAVAAVNPSVVAVMSAGSAVEMPWLDKCKAVIHGCLCGQAGASAVLKALVGEINPSGKLAESYPIKYEDVSSAPYFPAKQRTAEYREGLFVGYRYYDKAHKEVAYPFGHGLSYTTFAYSKLKLSAGELGEKDELTVQVTVKNTGSLAGKEVVQIYVAPPAEGMFRPARELRAYTKVELAPGESKNVELALDRRAFAYYDVQAGEWRVDEGMYAIEAGSSSRDIRLTQAVKVKGTAPNKALNEKVPAYCNPLAQWPVSQEQFEAVLGHRVPPERKVRPFTTNSTLGEIQTSFVGRFFVKQVKANMVKTMGGTGMDEFTRIIDAMLEDMPLRQQAMLSGGAMTSAVMDGLVEIMNGHFFRGLKNMRG